jgi:hypothetical protein
VNRSTATMVMAPVASVALAMRRRYRHWWWLPGWLFAALTIAPALLAIAWLVPGVAMLAAGRLTPQPMVIIFVPLAAALCYFTMRRMPVSWPRFRPDSADADYVPPVPASRRPDVPVDAVITTVVIAVAFAVWEALRHSQQLLAGADPGVYLQYGYWIAMHGSAKIPMATAAFGGQGPLDFNTYGFIPEGSSLTPDFLPGLPLVLAAGVWLHGISGALLAGPVIAGGAVLSFAGLCGRLAGPRWAPVGALVLALTVPEQYTGRTTLSEPLVQVLLFGGLCLIVDSLVVTRRRHAAGAAGAVASGVAGGGLGEPAPVAAMILAGVGGFAFGLTLLVWIGALSLLLPVFPVLALMFVARRPQAGPMAMGVFLGAACGLFAALSLARPYLSSQSSSLHVFGMCAAGFGVVTALVAPLGFPPVRAWARRVLVGRPRLPVLKWRLPSIAQTAQWVLFAAPVVILIGFAVRPYVQVTKGFTDPYVVRYVASLQRLTHLPVNGRRQYYETSLNWVIWYLGIPAVLLACAGAALLGRRMIRAVYAWRTSATAARLWSLTYLVVAWSVVTVLWYPSVLPGQPSASRRLVPVVLPGLVLLAVWSACQLKGRAHDFGARRVTSWAVGTCCALALVIPAFWSAFAPSVTIGHKASSGLTASLTWRGVATTKTGLGTVAAVHSLCSAIGPDASVVFTDALTADYFAPVVRDMCGQPATLVLASGSGGSGSGGSVGSLGVGGSGDSGSGGSGTGDLGISSGPGGTGSAVISEVVTSIERTGRQPVLLGASQSSVSGFGSTPRLAVSLQTRTDPSVLNGPPAGTWPFFYTVWLADPSTGGSSTTPGLPSGSTSVPSSPSGA